MRTQLIPATWLKFRKERGSVACWGQKQRNRKPSILRDANARRVWARLNCLKPGPHGLIVDASEKMVETLDQKVGAYVVDALLSNPSGISSIRGATGRTGTLEHVVSHSAANAEGPKQEQSCVVTEPPYYPMKRC